MNRLGFELIELLLQSVDLGLRCIDVLGGLHMQKFSYLRRAFTKLLDGLTQFVLLRNGTGYGV